MKLNSFAVLMFALHVGMGGLVSANLHAAELGPPSPGFGDDRYDWDAPPRWFNDTQRRGFRDGMDGARKDFGNHRQPDVRNRWEYLDPHLPPELWEGYREGFRRGYSVAMSRLIGASDPGRWDMVPQAFNDIQRRGFLDGIEGAQKDFGNHRKSDVNNRDEYRHPDDVPRELLGAYREGFRLGYDQGMAHLMGQPGPNMGAPNRH